MDAVRPAHALIIDMAVQIALRGKLTAKTPSHGFALISALVSLHPDNIRTK
jgi:hypothetical protein